jgi:ankyrin
MRSINFFSTTEYSNVDKLINAAIDGDYVTIKALKEQAFDINAQHPSYGDTALSQAALKGHQRIVELLIDNSNQYSKDLALIFASQAGNTVIIEILLSNEANVNANYFAGYPAPLYQTIMHHKLESFKALLNDINIDLNLILFGDCTPLLLSARYGRIDMITLLLEKGVDINQSDKIGRDACSIAKAYKQQAVIDYFENIDHAPQGNIF